MYKRQEWVQPADRVADDEVGRPQGAQDAHRKGDLPHRVPLVVVNASAHHGAFHSADPAEKKLAGVPLDGRDREVRDVRVGDPRLDLDAVGQRPETGPEDEPDRRAAREEGSQMCPCLADPSGRIV